MKHSKKLPMIVIFLFLLSLMTVPAAAICPYSSYTYDSYGNSVDTADLYMPELVLNGHDLGLGVMISPTDMYVADDSALYILDAGNSRIIVLDGELRLSRVLDMVVLDGEKQEFKKANGIYVSKAGNIYLADTGNNRVLCMDANGVVFHVVEKPESEYFSEYVEFLPTKIGMDQAGNMYVQSTGIYQGLVVFDKEFQFQGFYGADLVQTTAEALSDFFWKQFMTQAQRNAMANYVPPEIQNFDITENDFFYTVTPSQMIPLKQLKTDMDSIRYLNPKGTDRLVVKMSKGSREAMELDARLLNFVDVCYDERGFINLVDSMRGKIYQYDTGMNLITAFGALGDYKGTFSLPTAIEVMGSRILVLDKTKCNLTVFALTETGQKVHHALELYNAGKYSEAIDPWLEVIKENSNFELAYIGVGNALYNEQDYKGAMEYFKLGRDSEKYSEAYKEYRVEFLRKYMNLIIALTAVALLLGAFWKYRKLIPRKGSKDKAYELSHKKPQ